MKVEGSLLRGEDVDDDESRSMMDPSMAEWRETVDGWVSSTFPSDHQCVHHQMTNQSINFARYLIRTPT